MGHLVAPDPRWYEGRLSMDFYCPHFINILMDNLNEQKTKIDVYDQAPIWVNTDQDDDKPCEEYPSSIQNISLMKSPQNIQSQMPKKRKQIRKKHKKIRDTRSYCYGDQVLQHTSLEGSCNNSLEKNKLNKEARSKCSQKSACKNQDKRSSLWDKNTTDNIMNSSMKNLIYKTVEKFQKSKTDARESDSIEQLPKQVNQPIIAHNYSQDQIIHPKSDERWLEQSPEVRLKFEEHVGFQQFLKDSKLCHEIPYLNCDIPGLIAKFPFTKCWDGNLDILPSETQKQQESGVQNKEVSCPQENLVRFGFSHITKKDSIQKSNFRKPRDQNTLVKKKRKKKKKKQDLPKKKMDPQNKRFSTIQPKTFSDVYSKSTKSSQSQESKNTKITSQKHEYVLRWGAGKWIMDSGQNSNQETNNSVRRETVDHTSEPPKNEQKEEEILTLTISSEQTYAGNLDNAKKDENIRSHIIVDSEEYFSSNECSLEECSDGENICGFQYKEDHFGNWYMMDPISGNWFKQGTNETEFYL